MKHTEILTRLEENLSRAYSPYSTVKVAAAVVYEDGGEEKISYGVNVENVSYGLTLCAERNAVGDAVVNGMKSIKAVYLMSNQSDPVLPCGACRQVVTEFMHDADAPVFSSNVSQSKTWQSTLGELLPNRFDL
ncbi:cytidine deaminase [Ningiella sp. W23]|uniref:cytidine deaminase n=1 Tax=Ningiella sp. W23 TaxID=3023715 RepID=UPI003756BB56